MVGRTRNRVAYSPAKVVSEPDRLMNRTYLQSVHAGPVVGPPGVHEEQADGCEPVV
jgi:hypothetical protein